MKNKSFNIIFLVSIALLLLSGCSGSESGMYSEKMDEIRSKNTTEATTDEDNKVKNKKVDKSIESSDIDEEKELRGTLTVSTYWDGYMTKRAEEFMELYPNVKIEVKGSENNQNASETLEMYGNRIAVELMSGTATDLVDLAKFDIYKQAKSGLLCDLYKFMDNDKAFDKSDYYTNIFEAMEYNGGLYAMPFAFEYNMLYINRKMAEKLDIDLKNLEGLNYIEMMDIYEKAKEKHKDPKNFRIMPGIVKESFDDYEFPEFYDVEKNKAWFDSQEFLDYLNITNSIETKYMPDNTGSWDMTRVSMGNDDFMESKYMFVRLDINAVDVHNLMIDYDNISEPVPLLNSQNNAMVNTFFGTYGIPQSSKNKELAWEFLKYCISEREAPESDKHETAYSYFMDYHGCVPINIKNFYNLYEYQYKIDRKNFSDLNIPWKKGNQEELIKDVLDKVHSWNLERNKLVSNFELWSLTKKELDNFYYYDLSTAEETAKIIQNKVMSYLNE